MKDKEKQNKVNEYFANTLIKNCKRIVEQADKEIEEMTKIIALEMCPTQKEYSKFNNEATCYFARCRNIKNAVDKLINAGYRKLPEDSVVLTKEEYNALIAEYKAITYKYDDICDRYRLCKDANETIKQHAVMTSKETAEKILSELMSNISEIRYDAVCDSIVYIEDIIKVAKQFGVEIKE